MAGKSTQDTFLGAAGRIHCDIDWPDTDTPRGWALLLHPHPLYGGSRDNKVVTTLARACTQAGLVAVRPDFRGVGQSEGDYDEGRGETVDMQRLLDQFGSAYPELAKLPFVLGGFSFGTVVASQVLAGANNSPSPDPVAIMMVGTAAERFPVAPVPEHTLVVHGELDETVSLQSVFDWARPQELPVVVIPDATHFFHGKLVGLKQVASRYLALQLDGS